MLIHLVYQPTTLARAFNENLGNWTENKHFRIARQFRKYRRLKSTQCTCFIWLNTFLEMCILLHLSMANKCTIVVSEEHEMASFIQTEQFVNVAYLHGPLVIDNKRMNCKHGMLRSSQ